MSYYEFNPDNFETFGELFDKVMEIQAKLFPEATLETQAAKFEEEAKEQITAKNYEEGIKELADMCIVACGIMRFSDNVGKCLLGGCVTPIMYDEDKVNDIFKAVCDKMNKNQKRKWDNNNGYYKHVSVVN